jgi:hypothetical protein
MEGWSLRACDEEQTGQAYRLGGEHCLCAVSNWAGGHVAQLLLEIARENVQQNVLPQLTGSTRTVKGQSRKSEGDNSKEAIMIETKQEIDYCKTIARLVRDCRSSRPL